jgi:hypothetical protein
MVGSGDDPVVWPHGGLAARALRRRAVASGHSM